MGDTFPARAARLGIEIGVKDAAGPSPLQLHSRALADLEGGLAKSGEELAGGQADEGSRRANLWCDGGCGGWRGLRRCGAGGDQQGGEGGETAHGATIAILAAFASRG